MIDRFLAFIILGVALVFALTAISGLKRGFTRIPLHFLEFEEFDRTENTANFWGIIALNFSVALGCGGLLIYWFLNGMIE